MPEPTPLLIKFLGFSIGIAVIAVIIGISSAIPAAALWALLNYVLFPLCDTGNLSFFQCWIVTTALAVLLKLCRSE